MPAFDSSSLSRTPTIPLIPQRPLRRIATATLVAASLLWVGNAPRVGLTAEATPETAAGSSATPTPVSSASRERIADDLRYLSDDRLAGRDTGSEGIDLAAEYIAERFRSLGLNTTLFNETPFQQFTALRESVAGPAEENQLTLRRGDEEPRTLEFERAIRPLALGGSGRAAGPLVFAGYGITAPEAGYDDYAGIDAAGKLVVVIRGEPRAGRDDNPLGGPETSRHAYFATKAQNAIDHGAVGLLIVNRPDAVAEEAELANAQLQRQLEKLAEVDAALKELPEQAKNSRARLEASRKVIRDQLEALRRTVESAPEGLLGVSQAGRHSDPDRIPVASLGRRTFAEWFVEEAPEGIAETLEAWEAEVAETMQPRSFAFERLTATLHTSVESRNVMAKNVIAELPGRGPLAAETVVIGAHYDHVGMGGMGSLAPGTVAVHNGADDNGSGTAILLETARRLAEDRPEASRRIVFIAFTAEEKGLLGSKHYVRNPRFPLEETVAMINLDMVGRLDEEAGLTVFGTGTAKEFDSLVDRLNAEAGLPIRKDPSGLGPSDHASFYEKQIPVLFFFTGLHPDYHRPSDDFEKINLDGMVRITDMVTQTARHLATVAERPSYQEAGPGGGIHQAGHRAYLGVQLAATGGSVELSEVLAGGPADEAGLRTGDRIVHIDGLAIQSLGAVQRAVASQKPGDVMEIVVRRGGQQIRVIATLGKRP
ncbi:M20/M25/M40 family metallo-hydrolase [Candidatus Laterigemmans baculatus]|uniref:M20/M25/M40 family metallo-hydrolase n=1 Tax=Candidatus Laterigemmans baculatus TaxID=2770505 RepID=UPI0013D9484A|nr:M20/M25/M40 family metallo-hydrolase [Candidatus Laterigemmans baculatus]